MNATEVLKKIMTTLSLVKEEVHFTYAKLADGTVVESPTFDVGEKIDVVTEEGKTPAPDGEHELALKDSEGRDVIIKVMTKDGVITERENVELPASEAEREVEEMESIAGDDMGEFIFQFLFIVNSTEFTYLFDVLGFVAAQNA